MRDNVQYLTEVQVDTTYCSHLIYQASDFTIKVYQVDQALLPSSETMLDTPDDFF